MGGRWEEDQGEMVKDFPKMRTRRKKRDAFCW